MMSARNPKRIILYEQCVTFFQMKVATLANKSANKNVFVL